MDSAKYAELFLAESREHLTLLNQQLLAWEQDPDAAEPVAEIFRAIHTVKGMAATMSYGGVADIAHRVENLLDALRRRGEAPPSNTLEVLFSAADHLETAVERAVAGETDLDASELFAAIDRLLEAIGPVRRTDGHPRPSGSRPAPPVPSEEGGRVVRIRIRQDAPLKGARALLVLQKCEALGRVYGVHPPPAALESEGFDGVFRFQLETDRADGLVEDVVRAAGDVEVVHFGEAAGAAAARAEEAKGTAKTRSLRVDIRRMDRLMDLIGELVTARSRLADLSAERADPLLEDVTMQVAHLSRALQAEIIQARMTPVWQVFDRFPRMVRDVARQVNKRVAFEVEGKEIELDRAILDEIGDPLVHVIRNAIDHGIEGPDERVSAGKPEEGRVVLSAAREGSTVVIRVSDDGRGIDREAVLAGAKEAGLIPEDVPELTDEMLTRVLARPGFSTAHEVSEVSGRGVGIDVVLNRLQALGGALEIQSVSGGGSAFTLRLPPTLAIMPALLARVGEERYALPLTHVEETVDLDPARVTRMNEAEAIVVRDQVVPIVHLREVVGVAGGPPTRRPVIVLQIGDRRGGVVVDSLLGQREIVVKSFDTPPGTLPIFSGATILGDGVPVLILDAARLV